MATKHLILGSLMAASAAVNAQTTPPASAAAASTQPSPAPAKPAAVVAAPQQWGNGVEFICRQGSENASMYQVRINQRLREFGLKGWELVALAAAPSLGQDCFVFGLKQAFAR